MKGYHTYTVRQEVLKAPAGLLADYSLKTSGTFHFHDKIAGQMAKSGFLSDFPK